MLAALAVSEMGHVCLCVIPSTTEVVPQPVAACTKDKLSTILPNVGPTPHGHVFVDALASRH